MSPIRALLLVLALSLAAVAPIWASPKHAVAPHPGRVVAQKHHSKTLLTEAQLRASAGKIKHAAKKLMGTKAEALMPTWSTTTPLPVKKTTILDEGRKNLKLQKDVAEVEMHDDRYFQADDASTSGN
jgi:hypothetical protein